MRMAAIFVSILGVARGKSDRRAFTLRSDIDPSKPLDIVITVSIPHDWPQPRIDRDGQPHFTFGTAIPWLAITATQSLQADERARVLEVERDQLIPAAADRVDAPHGRRWVTDRSSSQGTAAWLFMPGPRDSVVTCAMAFMKPERAELYQQARDFCDGLQVEGR